MTMYSIKRIILVLFLGASVLGFSQSDFVTFGESGFDINHKVSQDYRVNFRLATRYFLYEDNTTTFNFRQVDFVHFSTFNLTFNHSISAGIQYRNRELIDGGNDELRLSQQFNYTKKRFSKRFGHRFRLEERIFKNSTTFRLRYRFAVDFPLNGEKVDVGESYMVTSTEALWSMNRTFSPQLDHRTTAQIGWQLSKSFKIQTGLEWRFEQFNIDTQQRLFLLTTGVLKI